MGSTGYDGADGVWYCCHACAYQAVQHAKQVRRADPALPWWLRLAYGHGYGFAVRHGRRVEIVDGRAESVDLNRG